MSETVSAPSAVWRLIDTGVCTGPRNMAIDEALLRSYRPGESQPVFRLYGWHPATLSLGRFQNAEADLDLARCGCAGQAVVRRVTGGGAIFHADELTYSLVCSQDQIPDACGVKDSFRVLTSFLLGFYRTLGLSAGYAVDLVADGTVLGQRTALCFAGKESYDILINGRKIGGNAQRRSRQLIFQHGSIPLQDRVADGLAYLKQAPPGLHTTCLQELGVSLDLACLKQQLIEQFEQQMGATLQPGGLTLAEQQLAGQLEREKYGSDQWNLKGMNSEDTTQA